MQREAVINLAAAILAGVFTSAVAIVSIDRLPNLAISKTYFKVQMVLVLLLLGMAPAVVHQSKTAYARLIGVFMIVGGMVTLLAIGVMYVTLNQLAISLGLIAFAITLTAGFVWAGKKSGKPALLFHVVGLLVLILYVFGVLYVGTAMVSTANLNLIVAFVILTGITVLVVKACSIEINSVKL